MNFNLESTSGHWYVQPPGSVPAPQISVSEEHAVQRQQGNPEQLNTPAHDSEHTAHFCREWSYHQAQFLYHQTSFRTNAVHLRTPNALTHQYFAPSRSALMRLQSLPLIGCPDTFIG
jgi:hypothetical protein